MKFERDAVREILETPDNLDVEGAREIKLTDASDLLGALRTKPGALRGSLSLFQADSTMRRMFFQHFEKRPRDFIELLLFVRQHNHEIVHLQKAIDTCMSCCPQHPVSLDKLKILLNHKQHKPVIEHPTEELSRSIARHCEEQLQDIQSLIF